MGDKFKDCLYEVESLFYDRHFGDEHPAGVSLACSSGQCKQLERITSEDRKEKKHLGTLVGMGFKNTFSKFMEHAKQADVKSAGYYFLSDNKGDFPEMRNSQLSTEWDELADDYGYVFGIAFYGGGREE